MENNLKLLQQFTKNFDEVKQLLDEHKTISKQIRTVERKLKTVEAKYKFLTDLISKGGTGKTIEKASKLLFKSAGFDHVRHLTKVRPEREDLQIWCDDCLILVECKGIKSSVPPDHEISQIKKYIDHRKNIVKSQLPVFGLTILNHDNSKDWDNRNPNPVDNQKNEYAMASEYGIVTTLDLVQGFILLKNKGITFEQFKNLIKRQGLIKFK